MLYRVSIYCRDCTGQDDMGCFDGGSELLYDRRWAAVREFDTLEEAKAAGWEKTKDCGPWGFTVLDSESREVFDSDDP